MCGWLTGMTMSECGVGSLYISYQAISPGVPASSSTAHGTLKDLLMAVQPASKIQAPSPEN